MRSQAESKRWGYVLVGILVEGQQAKPGHVYLFCVIFHCLFVYHGVQRKRVCEAELDCGAGGAVGGVGRVLKGGKGGNHFL